MIAHAVRTAAPNSGWPADLVEHLETHPANNLAAAGFPDDWLEAVAETGCHELLRCGIGRSEQRRQGMTLADA